MYQGYKRTGRKTQAKPERNYHMKIATLRTLSTLTTDEAILSEINAEIERLSKAEARNAERKAEKNAMYAEAHEVVMGVLADATGSVTAAEIFEECENALPEGFSKSNLSYALRALWSDEVVKTEGRVNTYAIKA